MSENRPRIRERGDGRRSSQFKDFGKSAKNCPTKNSPVCLPFCGMWDHHLNIRSGECACVCAKSNFLHVEGEKNHRSSSSQDIPHA
ncbi:hypothetical protein POVWA2_042380 [Plasmodium ovale wallikeri]|uniref:Uncharacterized protein n=1 Tax=Plasmodium ovale wallikeri TaxID=864142 RepID=A0A1A8ZBV6_PLAOA|nr:hypothetical protein POVWA1_043870 [Plasmodium ovale wallikeri]SBT41735.1 hypothetical protein POVWA2_042380 [Plasmodium ovale wallikeri]